jgi:hypothetical protein
MSWTISMKSVNVWPQSSAGLIWHLCNAVLLANFSVFALSGMLFWLFGIGVPRKTSCSLPLTGDWVVRLLWYRPSLTAINLLIQNPQIRVVVDDCKKQLNVRNAIAYIENYTSADNQNRWWRFRQNTCRWLNCLWNNFLTLTYHNVITRCKVRCHRSHSSNVDTVTTNFTPSYDIMIRQCQEIV